MEREDSQIPRAVVFRDSFSTALIPFLSEHFGRIVYLWQYDLDAEVIERERPDVVILQMTERALASHPPTNPPMQRARAGDPSEPVDPPSGP